MEMLIMLRGVEPDTPLAEKTKKICPLISADILYKKGKVAEAIDILERELNNPHIGLEAYLLKLLKIYCRKGRLEDALECITKFIEERKIDLEYVYSLKMLIEGNMYYKKKDWKSAMVWCPKALKSLEKKFNLGLFVLYERLSIDVLQEEESNVETEIFNKLNMNNEEYINTAEDISEIFQLLKYLKRKQKQTVAVRKVLIRRNPFVPAYMILEYVNETKDTDTLIYAIERRPTLELKKFAVDIGVFNDELEKRYANIEWKKCLMKIAKKNTITSTATAEINTSTTADAPEGVSQVNPSTAPQEPQEEEDIDSIDGRINYSDDSNNLDGLYNVDEEEEYAMDDMDGLNSLNDVNDIDDNTNN